MKLLYASGVAGDLLDGRNDGLELVHLEDVVFEHVALIVVLVKLHLGQEP